MKADPVETAAWLFCVLCSAVPVDQWEDVDRSGHVLRWSAQPAQQMAQTPGLHGRTAVQQRMAGQNREGLLSVHFI